MGGYVVLIEGIVNPTFQMANLVERFNDVASSLSVPANLFKFSEIYPILLATKERTRDGPRLLLCIIVGLKVMGRIYLPTESTSTFTLMDMWVISADRVKYKLCVREMAADGKFVFQLHMVTYQRLHLHTNVYVMF